jgi:hypothetical protein
MDDLPSGDQLLASAVKLLIELGENEAAGVLLTCSIDHVDTERDADSDGWEYGRSRLILGLRCPGGAFHILDDKSSATTKAVVDAFCAITPYDYDFGRIIVRGELMDVRPGWRSELLELLRGGTVSNQGSSDDENVRSGGVGNQATTARPVWTYQYMRFRSPYEVELAKAFDQLPGVLYFPGCKGRMTGPHGRENREPDFLVCKDGKWGILEVDGGIHTTSTKASEDERDRIFKKHGVKVVEHYDNGRVASQPDAVVKEFLSLLAKT